MLKGGSRKMRNTLKRKRIVSFFKAICFTFCIYSIYFYPLNIFFFPVLIIPQSGAPCLVCQLQTAYRCRDRPREESETQFCLSRCRFRSFKEFPPPAPKQGDSEEVRGKRDGCTEKPCCLQPHIFLICLV